MRPSTREIQKRGIERGGHGLGIFSIGSVDVDIERMALLVGMGDKLRSGNEIGGGGRPGGPLGVAGVRGREFERGQQQKRPRANAERRIGITRRDRQQPLRRRSERQGVGRRLARRRRTRGRLHVDRPRNRQRGAGPPGRRQRMQLGRRMVHRQGLGGRRQCRTRPCCGSERMDLWRRRRFFCPGLLRRRGPCVRRYRGEGRLPAVAVRRRACRRTWLKVARASCDVCCSWNHSRFRPHRERADCRRSASRRCARGR